MLLLLHLKRMPQITEALNSFKIFFTSSFNHHRSKGNKFRYDLPPPHKSAN